VEQEKEKADDLKVAKTKQINLELEEDIIKL
jgi:hypothetical protein